MKAQLPWWMKVIIVLQILPMFLGPLVALTNPRFLGGPEAEAITYAAYIYSARNLAVGIALIIAWVLSNGPMLFILIFVRLFTDLIDLPTVLSFDLASNPTRLIAIFVFLYYIPAVIALRYLWKQMRTSDEN
jgi:hypothetical protein